MAQIKRDEFSSSKIESLEITMLKRWGRTSALMDLAKELKRIPYDTDTWNRKDMIDREYYVSPAR